MFHRNRAPEAKLRRGPVWGGQPRHRNGVAIDGRCRADTRSGRAAGANSGVFLTRLVVDEIIPGAAHPGGGNRFRVAAFDCLGNLIYSPLYFL